MTLRRVNFIIFSSPRRFRGAALWLASGRSRRIPHCGVVVGQKIDGRERPSF
jgi:hypothetical protein